MTQQLASFLDRLASGSPAPGGGAAVALAAAASAALVGMVCRVTARQAPSEALAHVEREADALRLRLIDLIQEDAEAVMAVVGARRRPMEHRSAAIRSALVRATEIPLNIARASERVLELCDRLVTTARASAVADLGVAATLATSALEGAALTARVNVLDIEDATFVSGTRAAIAKLVDDAMVTRHRLIQIVAARTGIPA